MAHLSKGRWMTQGVLGLQPFHIHWSLSSYSIINLRRIRWKQKSLGCVGWWQKSLFLRIWLKQWQLAAAPPGCTRKHNKRKSRANLFPVGYNTGNAHFLQMLARLHLCAAESPSAHSWESFRGRRHGWRSNWSVERSKGHTALPGPPRFTTFLLFPLCRETNRDSD